MISDEEFEALKKEVANLRQVALHYKNFYEHTFPEHVNKFAEFLQKSGDTTEAFGNRLSDVIQGVGKLAQAVEGVQDELELR